MRKVWLTFLPSNKFQRLSDGPGKLSKTDRVAPQTWASRHYEQPGRRVARAKRKTSPVFVFEAPRFDRFILESAARQRRLCFCELKVCRSPAFGLTCNAPGLFDFLQNGHWQTRQVREVSHEQPARFALVTRFGDLEPDGIKLFILTSGRLL